MTLRRQTIMLTLVMVLIIGAFFATLLSDKRPALGLDLRGGVSVVLTPVPGSDLSTLDTAAQIIRNRVDGLGIAEPDVSRQGNQIVVDLPGAKNQDEALALVGKTAELRFRVVQGSIPYSKATAPATTTTTAKPSVNGSTTTVANGATTTTAKPTATTKKSLATRSIQTKPIVATRPEAGPETTTAPASSTTTATAAAGSTTTTTTAPEGDGTCQNGKLVTPPEQNTTDAQSVILPDREKKFCYLLGPTLLTGRDVSGAETQLDPSRGWLVLAHFKNDDFATKVAQPNVGKAVAITLDQEVESAPTIQDNITGTTVEITGNFSSHDASQLALQLKYGSLPVQFTPATSQKVSPTLGKDQLSAGIAAGLIGLALVALYMIFFYRLLGLVVWLGLGLTAMTFFALVTFLSSHQGLTLTLAGITGIIVSVGVTVDSYVVYFERLKDEVRTGKTVRSSLEPGFRRAWRTIFAADLVSLLGAVVLYLFATGSVRGFAYFLGLSTALDLFLAYTFMFPLVTLLARRPKLVRLPGVGIASALDVPDVQA